MFRITEFAFTSAIMHSPSCTEVLDPDRLNEALFVPGRERPVMIDEDNYRAFKASHGDALRTLPVLPLREVLLLMPGPYAACGPKGTARAPRSG